MCPVHLGFTAIPLEALSASRALLGPTAITQALLPVQHVHQVSTHLCKIQHPVTHVHKARPAIPPAVLSVGSVLQAQRLYRPLPKNVRLVAQECTSLPNKPCVRFAAVVFIRSTGAKRTVTCVLKTTTALVLM